MPTQLPHYVPKPPTLQPSSSAQRDNVIMRKCSLKLKTDGGFFISWQSSEAPQSRTDPPTNHLQKPPTLRPGPSFDTQNPVSWEQRQSNLWSVGVCVGPQSVWTDRFYCWTSDTRRQTVENHRPNFRNKCVPSGLFYLTDVKSFIKSILWCSILHMNTRSGKTPP